MRVVIVGLGVQGVKRLGVAGDDAIATVDPQNDAADFASLREVPLESYEAALICTPDEVKYELIVYLAENGKHALVEKPLLFSDRASFEQIRRLCRERQTVCYTAYNHRFEPHFIRMKSTIESGRLGRLYTARLFYGNGTARLVRNSVWRDRGAGVLSDLGSHLLDTVQFWFGRPSAPFAVQIACRHENAAFDHVAVGNRGMPALNLEMMLLSWRNCFYADVYGEHGSAHIQSLCKWGPATFTLRDRKLPSGRPDEDSTTLVRPDPTWEQEYRHFVSMCNDPEENHYGNIENDLWICDTLTTLYRESEAAAGESAS